MNLRFKRKKPEQQQQEAEKKPSRNKNKAIAVNSDEKITKKKNRLKQKKVDDAPIQEQDVINILLERFFSPRRDDPIPEDKAVEQEEELHEQECSTRIKKVYKSKKLNKCNTRGNVCERDGLVDSTLQPTLMEENRLAVPNEENAPEMITPSSQGTGGTPEEETLNYGANTRLVKQSSAASIARKSRGITNLACLTEDTNGVREMVEYNAKGHPIGPVAKKFSNYLGVLGRRMVPINHESWTKVPKELKEKLLNQVEAKYVIDPKRRKRVISSIGERWKSFKANLTKYFIKPLKEQPELLRCPPEKYEFIEQEHWDAFVSLRLSEEFQKHSKLQAERRAKNIYNHRLSRKGYAGLIEQLKQSLGASADELDRCVLWKKARQNKTGVYVNDAVREKAKLIDELTKQKDEGNLVTQGDKDILTLALGSTEHNYRVRGVGPVTRTSYFNLSKRNSKTYIREMEQKVNQQADKILEMNQVVQELQVQCGKTSPQCPPTIPSPEKISSSTYISGSRNLTTAFIEGSSGDKDESSSGDGDGILNDHHQLHIGFETDYQSMDKGNTKWDMSIDNSRMEKSKQCRLLDSKANIVAHGMVFERVEQNESIHNIPLGESNVRVAIENVVFPNALLPVPVIGQMTMVKDAIGSFVAWPSEFVMTGVQEEENQASGDQSGPIQAFASFIDQIMPTNDIIIPMQNVIFEEEVEAHLQRAHLLNLCNMQEMTAGCIMTYIRLLYDNLYSCQEKFGFVNPASISSARGPDASSMISKRLQAARKDQLFFIPYNTRGRWILIVVDSSSMDVYWLDPLQKPLYMDIKIYITTGLKVLRIDGTRRPNPTWHCIKCPNQLFDVQCGYYVMRYIKELMEEPDRPLAEKILQMAKKSSYSQDEVDEVRLELIDIILSHM